MTNLLNDRELDRVLDTWLDEGPARVSDLVIDGALGRIPTTRQRPVRRAYLPPALRTRAVTMPLVVAAVIAFVTLLGLLRVIQNVGPMPSASPTASASQPAPSALPTEVPSAASGRARIEVSGAAEFTEEWGFIRAEAIERYPGLRLYQFYELASTPCECPGGKYLDVHLDPNDPSAYPLGTPVPTSEELILRFGFVDDVYIDDDYVNGHLSMDGECRVTFTAFTEREIEATYECVDVPSETNQQLVNVVGTFSFDPREVTPEETIPARTDLVIIGSSRPAKNDAWLFLGCWSPAERQERSCVFSDGFHNVSLVGVLDPSLDPSLMRTDDPRIRVGISWNDTRVGEFGEYDSVAGECTIEFETLRATHAIGSIDCVDVPGEWQATFDDAPVAGTVSIHGTLTFDPSIENAGAYPG